MLLARSFFLATVLLAFCLPVAHAELRVGAVAIDVTPEKFPVLINGGMYSRSGESKEIYARAIVLDDGKERLALVVTDSCMLPKDLIDSAKQLAATRTQIKPERMMISATHTHTAPSSMGALGTEADETYVPYLRIKLAEAIEQAERNLKPAKVGWGSTDANEFTALRRWILRPDQMRDDPFGNRTVRATMHAARDNMANVTGEAGPEDPELSMISFQSLEGEPIALLSNFSMHYFGGGGGGADYFGQYCRVLEEELSPEKGSSAPFVAVMSHGCSGDIWRVDYREGTNQTFDGFVEGMVQKTLAALKDMEYKSDASLAMAEQRMQLNYRVPDKQLLEWSQRVVEEMGDRLPKTQEEVYAREQIMLHERQSTEIVVQAIRVGDVVIGTTPNETYALTGLKLKSQSPSSQTMVIELANGGDGYIPPPEQHVLGGYNTWAARSAGLETTAEPKIVEASLQLIEKVTGKPRLPVTPPQHAMAETIKKLKPVRYYPLDDAAGPFAMDASPHLRTGLFEDGVVFYLSGAEGKAFRGSSDNINRAAHFAGGRLAAKAAELQKDFSVSMWCWNGIDLDARPVAGWLFSRDHAHGTSNDGIHFGLQGKGKDAGKLVVQTGNAENLALGKSTVPRWTWSHVALVKTADELRVFLDGKLEITSKIANSGRPVQDLFLGGRSDNRDNWEGRLDEIALFDRALTVEEVAVLADRGEGKAAETAAALSAEEATRGGRHWVAEETPAPRSPEEQLASFQIEPGYRVELVAAEPLVMDPVAIAFDAKGRMFVAEYSDYPIGPKNPEDPPLSRIVMLEDHDGDGRMDHRTVFADHLTFCHSLMPYADGILACAQTEVLILRDTNGDGVADVREVLFQGFVPAHPQMQIGNPRWGLDNRIYMNYGVGKIVTNDKTSPVEIPRTEFWFDPLTDAFGPASGTGQYGNTFTAWGDRLFSTNRNPVIAVTMSWEEMRRNPHASIHQVQYDVAPSGSESRVFPLVAMKSNWLSHAGTHTSACGTTAYLGGALGESMANSVFACEPIGHLVTRAIVEREGARLVSRRAREDADFLASTDTWFRPSSLANGPDGMLYLADIYRLWVEHPKFLPPEVAAQLDWRAGEDRGRIWRIVPEGPTSARPYQIADTAKDLADLLKEPNGWRRFTAQRLIVERQLVDAAPHLEDLLKTAEMPLARLHALWTLDGIGQLSEPMMQTGLQDKEPRVRAAAVQLASRHWNESPALRAAVFNLAQDEDAFVRYRVALSLGETEDPRRLPILAKLAITDGDDATVGDAILSAAANGDVELVKLLSQEKEAPEQVLRRLSKSIGTQKNSEEIQAISELAIASAEVDRQVLLLASLAEGLGSKNSLEKYLPENLKRRDELTQRWRSLAMDDSAMLSTRRDAVAVLARISGVDDEFYSELCRPRYPLPVQQAAIAVLGGSLTDNRGRLLLDLWPELEPAARDEALGYLLKQSQGIELVMNAIRNGVLSPTLIGLEQQNSLRGHRNEQVRKAAEELFGPMVSTDRQAILAQYEPATRTIGSVAKGREVFVKTCAKCHVADEASGRSVGPDLSDSVNRARDTILFDILHPNGKVEPKYAASQILTTSGQSFSGVVASESPQSIVLQLADGRLVETPRADIELFQTSDKSLMPEGVEKEISVEQMANLLEFLKSPLPKK